MHQLIYKSMRKWCNQWTKCVFILYQIKSIIWGFSSLFDEDSSRVGHDVKSIGN